MANVLQELIQQLSLERMDENQFRGQSQDLGWGQVYGGQVLGQSLSAAYQTVPSDRLAHSMHAYFLRLGDVSMPVTYEVDRIRDGRSFTTRRVVAMQKGRPIFNMSASFQVLEEGFEHQDVMPVVPGPEGLAPEMLAQPLSARPIELYSIDPVDLFAPESKFQSHAVWMRATDRLDDAPGLHHALLAYASDFSFMPTALRPHGVGLASRKVKVASIDHVMWFHRPFRMDEWLLHVIHSPSASGARGMVRGSIFTRDGRLIASTAQEGLMRRRSPTV